MEEKKNLEDVWIGIGLLALLHPLLFLIPFLFSFIGLVQWVYVLPAVQIAKHKGRTGIAQGLLIGAGITFLLNVACFGFFVVKPGFFF